MSDLKLNLKMRCDELRKVTCEQCYFKIKQHCYRYPPTVVTDNRIADVRPIVKSHTQACGEFLYK